MNHQIANYDVIVVGAGLTGSAMASALAALSDTRLRIALIDFAAEPQQYQGDDFDPRVVALTPRSDQLLRSLGCWESITVQRACAYRDMTVWDGEGTASISFSCDEMRLPYLGHIVENSVVVRALLDDINASDRIDFIHPARVVAVHKADSANAELTRLELEDGRCFSAPLVIAADGGRSVLRDLADFSSRAWDYEQQAIVTTVTTVDSHQYTAWQRFMTSGPLAFLPLAREGDAHRCSIVWSADTARAEQLMALDDEAFCRELGRAFEYRLGDIVSVAERFSIPLRQQHARDYFQPGIVLIGDAAHSIHPLAGQGVNLGFLDVIALTDEIERALKRRIPLSDVSILRRYQRQRLPDNLQMMAAMEAFKRLFGTASAELTWLRNAGMRLTASLPRVKQWIVQQVTR